MVEFSKHEGHQNWDVSIYQRCLVLHFVNITVQQQCIAFCSQVQFHEKHFTDVFDKDKIVYLTSESDNVVEEIDQDKVYIIGGLVDHNSQKVYFVKHLKEYMVFI